MREWADFTTESEPDGALTLAFAGPLVVSSVGPLDRRLRRVGGPVARIDLAQVSEIDTVGAWLAWRLARDHGAKLVGASDKAKRLIAAVSRSREEGEITPPRPPLIERVPASVGLFVTGWGGGFVGLLGFLGAILVTSLSLIRNPRRFRMKALVRQVELVGVSALGIIGLMSFLIGIVIAQQGAVQLRQFGAEIYTVNLTGRLSLRELGILMTSIMVAGRSGSSFAAQIGTMKLTEEIDAMLMLPLLGFYSALFAIVGGAFISTFQLDIPFFTFLLRVQEVVPLHDLWVGLVKGPVFGLIVAVAGCYQGMQVKGNSEEVGLRTTVAVVQAIFMVIVLDAFFAVFFTEVGWG